MAIDTPALQPAETDTFKIVAAIRWILQQLAAVLPISSGADSRLSNLGLAVSAGSSALTIALKGADGSDPSASNAVEIDFRNVTGATGTPTTVSVTAATSLVISSGSTLGVASSTAFRLWIVGFNDGGTFRLGIINCRIGGATPTAIAALNEEIAQSSTAEGGAGAADSAGVIYTGTAVSSKSMRILGYAEWNASGLTAGTWTTSSLAYVQLKGSGVKQPGDTVDNILGSTTSQSTTASGTYQNSTLSAAMVLTSAANIVHYIVAADGFSDTATGYCTAQMHRGATAIGVPSSVGGNGAGAVAGGLGLCGLDNPNTTASTTYMAKFKAQLAGTAYFVNTGGTIILSELVG